MPLFSILSAESPLWPITPIKMAIMKIATAQASAFLQHKEESSVKSE